MRLQYPVSTAQFDDPLEQDDPFSLKKWRPTPAMQGTALPGTVNGGIQKFEGGYPEIQPTGDGDPSGLISSRPDPSLDPMGTAAGYGVDLSQAPQRVSGTSDLSAVAPLEYTRKAAEEGEKLAGMSARPGAARTVGAIAANWFLGRHGNPAGKMASDAILNSDPNTRAYNEQKRKYDIDSELAQQERQGVQTTALEGYHNEQAKTRTEIARSNELHARDQERQAEEKAREQKSKDAAAQTDAEVKAQMEYDKQGYSPAQNVPFQLPPKVDLPPVAPPPGEMPQPKQPPMFTPGQTRGDVEDIPEGAATLKNPINQRTMVQRRIPTPPAVKQAVPGIGDTMPETDLPKYSGVMSATNKSESLDSKSLDEQVRQRTIVADQLKLAGRDRQSYIATGRIERPPVTNINTQTANDPAAIQRYVDQMKENPDIFHEIPPQVKPAVSAAWWKQTGLPEPRKVGTAMQEREAMSQLAGAHVQAIKQILADPKIQANIGPIMGRIGNLEQSVGDTFFKDGPEAQKEQELRLRLRYLLFQEGKALLGGRPAEKLIHQLETSSPNAKQSLDLLTGALNGVAGSAKLNIEEADKFRFGGKKGRSTMNGAMPPTPIAESSPQQGQSAPFKVGDTVKLKSGKSITVTAVHPDGTFDGK